MGLPAPSAGNFGAFWHHLQGVPVRRWEYLVQKGPKKSAPACAPRSAGFTYRRASLDRLENGRQKSAPPADRAVCRMSRRKPNPAPRAQACPAPFH